MVSWFGRALLAEKYQSSFIFLWKWLFAAGSHYLLVDNDWESTNFPENNDCGIICFQGFTINCYTGGLLLMHPLSICVQSQNLRLHTMLSVGRIKMWLTPNEKKKQLEKSSHEFFGINSSTDLNIFPIPLLKFWNLENYHF